jgi:hypothetical protein
MADISQFCEGGPKIIPVLHLNEIVNPLKQIKNVRDAGADGIFLIDHESDATDRLDETVQLAKKRVEGFPIGVNYLQIVNGLAALTHIWLMRQRDPNYIQPDMLWADKILSPGQVQANISQFYPEVVTADGARRPDLPIFFGSTAFKYTIEYTEDPELAARLAQRDEPLADVLVTSGPATGLPANPAKIRAIKNVITKPLALSSGVTQENIGQYPGVDVFMVSSSIETAYMSGRFDIIALEGLIEAAKKLKSIK